MWLWNVKHLNSRWRWYHIPAPCMSQQDRGRNWLDQSVLLSIWYMSLPDTCDHPMLTRATCYCRRNQGLKFLTLVRLYSVSNNRKLMRLRREEMHEWTYFQHFLTFIIKNKPQNNGGQAIISGHKKYGAHFKTFTHIGWIATKHKATSKISRW